MRTASMRVAMAAAAVLAVLGGLLPTVDSVQAAQNPPSGLPPVDIVTLAAHRNAVLARQALALAVHNATAKARHEQLVRELGYEPSVTDPREIARQIMANKYGWGAEQFSCYHSIIMRESRWNPYADNPTSSAYGIPQALPGSRMAAFGADWRTNPVTQIRWGLDYVSDRYGTPCAAWAFKRVRGWY